MEWKDFVTKTHTMKQNNGNLLFSCIQLKKEKYSQAEID